MEKTDKITIVDIVMLVLVAILYIIGYLTGFLK